MQFRLTAAAAHFSELPFQPGDRFTGLAALGDALCELALDASQNL
jgi:hypothetical protein